MKFAICLALCMQLCAQLFADPIPAHQGLPQCTDSALTVTVDNQIIELYLDGTQVTGLKNKDTWGAVDTVHVPAATKVIAIKGFDYGQIAGILASGTFYKTDASWKCTNVYSDGWAAASFDDSAWPAATEIDVNGASPWGPIAGISNDAKWIWTAKFTYGPDSDRTVYCRKKPASVTVAEALAETAVLQILKRDSWHRYHNHGRHRHRHHHGESDGHFGKDHGESDGHFGKDHGESDGHVGKDYGYASESSTATTSETPGPSSDYTVGQTMDPTVGQTTGPTAITSCIGKANGDYQSNKGCHVYATCFGGHLYDDRPCVASGLLWDDNVKRCELSSDTCTEFVSPPPALSLPEKSGSHSVYDFSVS